jgi:hypothetical protein
MPTITTSKRTEVVSEPTVKKYKGICSTCNNAPTCMYIKDRKLPVSQCEEFDDYSPKQPKMAISSSREPSIASTSQEGDTVKYKGLCVNCENRKTCTLTKHEGGIWHCEEYL